MASEFGDPSMDGYASADAPAWAPLVEAAERARANAHAPYSRYRVGAALAFADGAIVAGCNVENASYGATICAERGAVLAAVAGGRRTFVACVVITPGPRPGVPCGICRQVLSEFARELPILLVAESGARVLVRLTDIFPETFGPGDLAKV
jgi:cytidine deaminase